MNESYIYVKPSVFNKVKPKNLFLTIDLENDEDYDVEDDPYSEYVQFKTSSLNGLPLNWENPMEFKIGSGSLQVLTSCDKCGTTDREFEDLRMVLLEYAPSLIINAYATGIDTSKGMNFTGVDLTLGFKDGLVDTCDLKICEWKGPVEI